MKPGRKRQTLTDKEAVIMNLLWDNGPLFVREMLEKYPEPKPHFNTIATTVRILEGKGYVDHEVFGPTHRFRAIANRQDFRDKSLAKVISDYFDNSYRSVVSMLVKEEKISVEDLKEIIEMMEQNPSDSDK